MSDRAKAIVFTPRGRGHRRQRRLAALAPSPWWVNEINAGRVRAFPTPMVRCPSEQKQCGGRLYPNYYVQDCGCEDCRNNALLAWEERIDRFERTRRDGTVEESEQPADQEGEQLPAVGAFAEMLSELAARGMKLAARELASDLLEDLAGEIARFHETGVAEPVEDPADVRRRRSSSPPTAGPPPVGPR